MIRYHTMFQVLQVVRVVFLVLVSTRLGLAATQDFTLRVDVPLVILDVSVTDETGRPVDGLKPADFEVSENGKPQRIRYFGSSAAPYHVYLLFDSSGSTEHKWDFMRRATAGFVNYIKPQDRVSIGIFDERLRTLSEWDDPREHTLQALNSLIESQHVGGTTEFYRSLENTIKESFDEVPERRAVIVLTDGRDTSLYQEIVRHNRVMQPEDDRRFKKLFETAQKSQIPIYFIAVNTDLNLEGNTGGADEYRNLQILYGDSPVPEQYVEQVRIRMEQISEVSGGQILFPRTLEDVAPLFEQIGKTLGHAYSLGYVPETEDSADPLRRIVVQVGSNDYKIQQSRAGYDLRDQR